MYRNTLKVMLFVISAMLLTLEPVEAGRNCNCNEAVKNALNSPFFAQLVYKVNQDYRNAQAACKSRSLFSFYDFTGQCHDCEKLCKNPESTLQCYDLCESYLVYQKVTAQYNPLIQQHKDQQALITSLEFQVVGSYCFSAVILILLVILLKRQAWYNKRTFATLKVVPVEGDAEEAKNLTVMTGSPIQQESNRTDPESAYESLASFISRD